MIDKPHAPSAAGGTGGGHLRKMYSTLLLWRAAKGGAGERAGMGREGGSPERAQRRHYRDAWAGGGQGATDGFGLSGEKWAIGVVAPSKRGMSDRITMGCLEMLGQAARCQ